MPPTAHALHGTRLVGVVEGFKVVADGEEEMHWPAGTLRAAPEEVGEKPAVEVFDHPGR